MPAVLRRLSLLTLVLAVTACAAPTPPASGPAPTAQATGAPKSGGTLRIGTSTDVLTLDLANYRGGQDWLIGSLIFEPLVKTGPDGSPQPLLAESWKQVDATTYQVTLHKGVKFQDGTPLTPAAVKQQFERASAGVFGKSYYYMIDSISADGDQTVTFKLKTPYAPFINTLAIMTGGIASPDSVAKYGDDLAHHPVGTGPFKLTSWVPGDEIDLERNPDYWGTPAKLDKIVIKFVADANTRMSSLQAGELEVVQNPPPSNVASLKTSQTLQALNVPYAQSIWLGFTHSDRVLADKRVRQAIAMVVDRNSLVEGVTEGLTRVATGFIPPEVLPSKTTPVPADINRAKQLLAEAGYPNGFQIALWATNGRYLADQEIAAAIQQQLKPLGIDAQVKIMDYAAFSAGLGRHEAGLFLLGWGFTANPDNMLRAVFQSKAASNWSAYANPEVDALIDQAVAEGSYQSTTTDWQKLDQALVDDVAGVPVYWASALYGASKKVHAFTATPLGLFDLGGTWMD